MQIIKLIETGRQDKLIAFDELPQKMLKGLKKDALVGYPRGWEKFKDSTYELFFKEINTDIAKWDEICSFCKRVVDPAFRLDDKMENMAIPVAGNQTEDVKIYPDNLAVIPIPLAHQDKIKIESVASPKAEVAEEDGPKKHACENKGRGGRLENPGACPRCDELRAKAEA